jgi:hypothetical protein
MRTTSAFTGSAGEATGLYDDVQWDFADQERTDA